MNAADPDISDRCALCQVKRAYHSPQFGKPSEVVASFMQRHGIAGDPAYEFVEPTDEPNPPHIFLSPPCAAALADRGWSTDKPEPRCDCVMDQHDPTPYVRADLVAPQSEPERARLLAVPKLRAAAEKVLGHPVTVENPNQGRSWESRCFRFKFEGDDADETIYAVPWRALVDDPSEDELARIVRRYAECNCSFAPSGRYNWFNCPVHDGGWQQGRV